MKLVGEIMIVGSHRINEISGTGQVLHQLCIFCTVMENTNDSALVILFSDRNTIKYNIGVREMDVEFVAPIPWYPSVSDRL